MMRKIIRRNGRTAVAWAIGCLALVTTVASALAQAPPPPAAPAPAAPPRPSIDEWLPQLRPGLWIKVEGEWTANGLRADEVKAYHGELDRAEVASVIASVDSTTGRIRTQLGVDIQVSPRAEREKDAKRGWTAVTVGALVEAEGPMQRDGSLLAEEVEVEQRADKPRPAGWYREHELTGRIEAVDLAARTLVVSGVSVRLDAKTRNKTRFID